MVAPEVTLTQLHRADGSATYSHAGYSIIGSVNGPIEVSRRDEIPEEATIEVNVRPAFGIGSPRERHLETLVHSTIRSIVLARSIPRTLVQITLQIKSLPEQESSAGVNSSLTILPHLLHTALLALLSSSIPLSTTLTSVLIALPSAPDSPPLLAPNAQQLLRSKPIRSTHVFAFSGDRRLLLNESDGAFTYEEWEEACDAAEVLCCGDEDDEEEDEGGVRLGSESMDVDGDGSQREESLETWLRSVVQRKVEWEQRWRNAR